MLTKSQQNFLKKSLRGHLNGIQFDENRSKATRAFVMSEIANRAAQARQNFQRSFGGQARLEKPGLLILFQNFTLVHRMALGVVSIAVLFMAVFGYSVYAAGSSLPGDILYPLKISLEKAQIGLAASPLERTELKISFIENRIAEFQKIASQNNFTSKASAEVIRHFNNELSSLKVEVASLENNLPKERVAAITKKVDEKSNQMRQVFDKKIVEAEAALKEIKVETAGLARTLERPEFIDEELAERLLTEAKISLAENDLEAVLEKVASTKELIQNLKLALAQTGPKADAEEAGVDASEEITVSSDKPISYLQALPKEPKVTINPGEMIGGIIKQ